MQCYRLRPPAVAKGMCLKHYMRVRRTGSAKEVRRPRRPKDERRAIALKVMAQANLSDRTIATWWSAIKLLKELGEDVRPAIEAATHPNGGLNTAKLKRIAEGKLMEAIERGDVEV